MNSPIDPRLDEEALERTQAAREERIGAADYFGYVSQSRAHLRACVRHAQLFELIDGLSEEQRATLLAMHSSHTPANVLPEQGAGIARPTAPPSSRPVLGRPERRQLLPKLLAGLIVLGAATAFALRLKYVASKEWAHDYRTAIGERRSETLADGSTIYLNTGTNLEVRFTAGSRRVVLKWGEAKLNIKQGGRPFEVIAGDVRVSGAGVELDVYRAPMYTNVAVEQGGSVAVKPASSAAEIRLTGRSGVRISPDRNVESLTATRLTNALGWWGGRLFFEGDELGYLAEEINRYNVTPKVYVEGAARGRLFSGVLETGSPSSLVRMVEKDPAYVVSERPGEIRIRLR